MKNWWVSVITGCIGFVAGIGVMGLYNSTNPVVSSVVQPVLSATDSISGSDQYEIEWEGKKGTKFLGTYTINVPSTPMKVENVNTTLPYKVHFSLPKNAGVAAVGMNLNHENVEIKIYKNGLECGKVIVIGSGAAANKACQSNLY